MCYTVFNLLNPTDYVHQQVQQ